MSEPMPHIRVPPVFGVTVVATVGFGVAATTAVAGTVGAVVGTGAAAAGAAVGAGAALVGTAAAVVGAAGGAGVSTGAAGAPHAAARLTPPHQLPRPGLFAG